MPAYVILDVKINDNARYEEYKRQAAPTVEMFGGKYLARGGRTEILEGNWSPSRLVILQFPSIDQARSWLNSPIYTEAKRIRHEAADSNMIVVEGV
jgi:uncharacterized protein (DUF1330 family)